MTTHTPKRRPYKRRYRHVYVTTIRNERSPEGIARVVTDIALNRTQRETDARADHHARLALNRAAETPPWQRIPGELGDA